MTNSTRIRSHYQKHPYAPYKQPSTALHTAQQRLQVPPTEQSWVQIYLQGQDNFQAPRGISSLVRSSEEPSVRSQLFPGSCAIILIPCLQNAIEGSNFLFAVTDHDADSPPDSPGSSYTAAADEGISAPLLPLDGNIEEDVELPTEDFQDCVDEIPAILDDAAIMPPPSQRSSTTLGEDMSEEVPHRGRFASMSEVKLGLGL